MIVVTDEEMNGRIRQIVDQLRRALQDSALVAHQIRACRDALASVGAQVQDLVLADRDTLACRDASIEPWPTHDEVRRVLRRHRELRERIAELRGDLHDLGIGPDLFE